METQLLSNVQKTRESIGRILDINNQLNSLFKSPIRLGCIAHAIVFAIYWLCGSYVLSFLLNVLYPLKFILSTEALQTLNNIMSIIIMIAVAISYPTALNLLNKKRLNANKKLKESENVRNLEEQKQIIFIDLEESTLIPKDYWSIYALNSFEKYLINKRADNLKECINLFEEEKRHEEQVKEIKVMQQLQEATYQRANEAATISWVNLLVRR